MGVYAANAAEMPLPEADSRHVRLVSVELPVCVSDSARRLTGPAATAQLIASFIGMKDREHFVVVHLSTQNEPAAVEIVSIGDISSAPVHPREVFKSAILANAARIIIGHNHPSGDLTPSQDDRSVWSELVSAGKLLGIEVLDFVIVGGGRWYSFVEMG